MSDIELGITADMHVHLRDGNMCELITLLLEQEVLPSLMLCQIWFLQLQLNNKLLIIILNFPN